ncbi:hypothetical protein BH09ACT1_BH09ACT1_17080 [soil metagenome]
MAVKVPWWDKLNRAFLPYLGPAQLGPFGEAPLPSVAAKACPICGHPMTEHDIERREGRPTQMHCPA